VLLDGADLDRDVAAAADRSDDRAGIRVGHHRQPPDTRTAAAERVRRDRETTAAADDERRAADVPGRPAVKHLRLRHVGVDRGDRELAGGVPGLDQLAGKRGGKRGGGANERRERCNNEHLQEFFSSDCGRAMGMQALTRNTRPSCWHQPHLGEKRTWRLPARPQTARDPSAW